jgi:hypothetical protein
MLRFPYMTEFVVLLVYMQNTFLIRNVLFYFIEYR